MIILSYNQLSMKCTPLDVAHTSARGNIIGAFLKLWSHSLLTHEQRLPPCYNGARGFTTHACHVRMLLLASPSIQAHYGKPGKFSHRYRCNALFGQAERLHATCRYLRCFMGRRYQRRAWGTLFLTSLTLSDVPNCRLRCMLQSYGVVASNDMH